MQSKTINSSFFYISIIGFVGLSFLIGIPQAINQWLHKDIFYKYFNKGETHWYYDLTILILFLSIYFYSSRLEKQLKISPFILSIIVLIIILLANYRISYNEYLTPIYFNTCNNWFKYLDALFLIPFIIIGAYYINYNSEDNNESKCNKCEKLKDKCICKKDILNTKSKVEYFLNTIESDFNFYGIVGKWGVGKTFFLKLLKIKLKDDDQNNVIIEFSPWKFNTTDLMIQDFSNKIENELVNKRLIKKNDYRKFSKEFIGSINTIKFSLVEFSTSFNTASNSDEQYQKINNALKNSDHKFYVLIDDLDRLQNDEIYKVLMFLRNVFNFDNLIFIAAYDKDYLAKSLDNLNIPNSRNYLEKIFQSEFFLYPLTIDECRYFLKDLLENKLKNSDDKQKIEELFSTNALVFTYKTEIFYPFRVYRNIIHFVNEFENYYQQLKEEVDFESLFYLTILKYFYKEVYDEIYINRNYYFALDSSFGELRSNRSFFNQNEKDNTPFIKKYIDSLQISEQDKECIDSIINKLFTQTHQKGIKSIASSNTFDKYITGFIPNTVISEKDFKNIINQNGKIEKLDKAFYPSFITFFRRHYFNEQEKIISIDIIFFLIKEYESFPIYDSVIKHKILDESNLEIKFIDKFFNEIKSNDINYIFKLIDTFINNRFINQEYGARIRPELDRIINQEQIVKFEDVLKMIKIFQSLNFEFSDQNISTIKNLLIKLYSIENYRFIGCIIQKDTNNSYYKIYNEPNSIFRNIFKNDLNELNEFFVQFQNKNQRDFLIEILKLIEQLRVSDNKFENFQFSNEFRKKYFPDYN